MAFDKENVIFVYRAGDSNSEEVADAYVDAHDLSSDQKRSISCSSAEVLSDEATFNSQVLDPIKNEISTVESGGRTVWGVVLGFNVPGGFKSGGDVISSTSRIARLNHSFDKKIRNNLFNRSSFKRFDSDDKDFSLIVTRIDAPTANLCKDIIERSTEIRRQGTANGLFYLDPYSDRAGKGAKDYEDALESFQERLLPNLNLDTFTTTFIDPYVDELIPSVQDDSFIWSWFTDRGSSSFFKESNSLRVFAYNADYDGAETVRDGRTRRWPRLYIQNGYAATAGAMSDPTNEGFLFPYPFFDTLLRGGTLGEAFLFSSPFLDWTISWIGDPLMTVSFPGAYLDEKEEGTDELESWRLTLKDISRAIAYSHKKTSLIESVRDKIVNSIDIRTEVDLLDLSQALFNSYNEDQRQSRLQRMVNKFANHMAERYEFNDIGTPNPTFNDVLSLTEFRVSRLLEEIYSNDNHIEEDNLLPKGWWQIEREIKDERGLFAFYHFKLQVSDKSDFSNILISKESLSNQSNWKYEKFEDEFENLGSGGVASSYVGQRIQYTSSSDEYLERGKVYYFRLRQRDQRTIYNYREFTDIIYT